MHRFYIEPKNISRKIVKFSELQSTQIRRVLRLDKGDKVEVFDGIGDVYHVELLRVTNKDTLGTILDTKSHERTSNFILIQSLPKNLKIEYILQKSTELGIDRIIFFESEYSQIDVTKISVNKVDRWKKIVSEAAEQSKRVFVPTVELYPDKLESLITDLEANDNSYYLDIEGKWLSDAEGSINNLMLFYIGPEGGFSPKEKEIFEKNNVKKIKISNNILRSETASSVILAQLQLLRK